MNGRAERKRTVEEKKPGCVRHNLDLGLNAAYPTVSARIATCSTIDGCKNLLVLSWKELDSLVGVTRDSAVGGTNKVYTE
jgi:hypothetical protein